MEDHQSTPFSAFLVFFAWEVQLVSFLNNDRFSVTVIKTGNTRTLRTMLVASQLKFTDGHSLPQIYPLSRPQHAKGLNFQPSAHDPKRSP